MTHPSFHPTAGEGVWKPFDIAISGRGPLQIARVEWTRQSPRERWLVDRQNRRRLAIVKAVGGSANPRWVTTIAGRSTTQTFQPTTLDAAQHQVRTFLDECPMDPIPVPAFDDLLRSQGIDPYSPRNVTGPCHEDLAQALDELSADANSLVALFQTSLQRSAVSVGRTDFARVMGEIERGTARCQQVLHLLTAPRLLHPVSMRLAALFEWTIALERMATRITDLDRPTAGSAAEARQELVPLCKGAYVQAYMSGRWPY